MNRWVWGGALLLSLNSQALLAGASCVVAKRLGDSLAIEWVAAARESALSATTKATEKLRQRGLHGKYLGLHPQANSELPHAQVVILKTHYRTRLGKPRTSYGCGFSAGSTEQAGQAALHDLQSHDWGWKPEYGYQLVKSFSY